MLARMGISFTVWDGDRVEEHNLSNQLYPESSLGEYKVIALKGECERFGLRIAAVTDFYINQPVGDIVILGLDSHEARKKVWMQIRRRQPLLFIDGRMSGEGIQIIAFDPVDRKKSEKYEKFLEEPTEAAICTARSIAYNLFVCAGYIGKTLQAWNKRYNFPTERIIDLATDLNITTDWEDSDGV
jgi:molybdopterin/thiamine biosynthesis adenylyltransferase